MRRSNDRDQDMKKVMHMLKVAIAAGEPCPSNPDIAAELGLSSRSGSVKILHALEEKGLIRVDRFRMSRRVTIIATGRATAAFGFEREHFRTSARRPVVAVDRTPCFSCGTRKDLGCHHHPRSEPMEIA